MNALGRGLSSLIPKRSNSNAGDIIDRIDSEDSFDIEKEVKITTNKSEAKPKKNEKKNVSKIKITEEKTSVEVQSNNEEELPSPKKPLVSLLSFDNFYGTKEEPAQSQKEVSPVEESAPAEDEMDLFSVEEEQTPPAAPDSDTLKQKEFEEEVVSPGAQEDNAGMWDKHEGKIEHVAVGDIVINPLQPRRSFDPAELEELASSIEQHGILQPLVVRRVENGYELIAGERRLRSAKKLKWERVPCVVRRDVKSDQSRLVFALIENIQRENLNPIEEAMAYKDLNEEYGLSHEEIGQRVGRSRVGITNIIRILQLPAEIQRGLAENKITMGHARAILMIPDQEKQIRFYHHLLDEGLTVRKAEIRARRIQRTMNSNNKAVGRARGKHPLALKYSPVLEDRYGFDANVRYLADKNQFEVVFKAHSESDIEELVGRLSGSVPLPKDVDKDVIDD